LKRQARQAAGGEIVSWESDALGPNEHERFWQHVIDWETAPSTTDFERLTEAGLTLPAPEALDDQQLTTVLWSAIRTLSRMGVFISQTDHLSDRELYTVLWSEALREEVPMRPDDSGWTSHIQLLGGGGEPQTYLYLKYYADADRRRDWQESFPEYDMPAHVDPPYDRDRQLPQRALERPRRSSRRVNGDEGAGEAEGAPRSRAMRVTLTR
jgi:hypothetical protein